ncbi:MAG: hypothetical protein HGA87_02255 [Desulfobulbaceae bacterium]|nr:hypothetical protein [Desulfobulbaceae bacterium]
MTQNDLIELIAQGESLTVEFKSDRQKLSDNDIYENIVALANTEGGVLFIGIEDDGKITGAQSRHGKDTDSLKLQSAIFNNTVPHVNTRISSFLLEDKSITTIEVDVYPEVCATSSGKSLRRVIGPDGKPQVLPFFPHEHRSRRGDLGLLDFSAQPVEGSLFEDLDPLEFDRLRKVISSLHGDTNLLKLDNAEIAKALRLVETQGDKIVPNVSGLLLLGKESPLQKFLPTHAVHFQVIDAKGDVKVNDTFRFSLLRIISEIETRFEARNEEREVNIGLFRLPIPDYSLLGFREAINNALLHRDYSKLDNVYIQWHSDHILITNPGAFPPGITTANILVHEPKPRNPRLAEAFKRVGLVEQTGRGVDKIFLGQLRYGRPVPDYSRSDATGVRVVIRGGKSSLEFAAFVYKQEKENKPLTLDELLVLNAVSYERRVDSTAVTLMIQKSQADARAVLESLLEMGFIEAKGEGRGRVYHLSSTLYRAFGKKEDYIRVRGVASHKHEAMILEYVEAHSKIERKHVMDLCGISGVQASRILKKMVLNKKLQSKGSPPRWVYYVKGK